MADQQPGVQQTGVYAPLDQAAATPAPAPLSAGLDKVTYDNPYPYGRPSSPWDKLAPPLSPTQTGGKQLLKNLWGNSLGYGFDEEVDPMQAAENVRRFFSITGNLDQADNPDLDQKTAYGLYLQQRGQLEKDIATHQQAIGQFVPQGIAGAEAQPFLDRIYRTPPPAPTATFKDINKPQGIAALTYALATIARGGPGAGTAALHALAAPIDLAQADLDKKHAEAVQALQADSSMAEKQLGMAMANRAQAQTLGYNVWAKEDTDLRDRLKVIDTQIGKTQEQLQKGWDSLDKQQWGIFLHDKDTGNRQAALSVLHDRGKISDDQYTAYSNLAEVPRSDETLRGSQTALNNTRAGDITATQSARVTKLQNEGDLAAARKSSVDAGKQLTQWRAKFVRAETKWYPRLAQSRLYASEKAADASVARANESLYKVTHALGGKGTSATSIFNAIKDQKKVIDDANAHVAALAAEQKILQKHQADLAALPDAEKLIHKDEIAMVADSVTKNATQQVYFQNRVTAATQRQQALEDYQAKAEAANAAPAPGAHPSATFEQVRASWAAWKAGKSQAQINAKKAQILHDFGRKIE